MPDIYSAKLEGADELAMRIALTAQKLRSEMNRALDELGSDAELIYAGHALKSTGRMARGIKARRAGNVVLVNAVAKDPKSGFDYVAVTRFGHKGRIVPRHDRGAATVLATRRERGRGGRASLMFSIGGKVLFRKSTKGFHPKGDWADTAWPQVKRAAEHEADKLGARVIARFL